MKPSLLALSNIIKSSGSAAHESGLQLFRKVLEKFKLQKFKSLDVVMNENVYDKLSAKIDTNETSRILGLLNIHILLLEEIFL